MRPHNVTSHDEWPSGNELLCWCCSSSSSSLSFLGSHEEYTHIFAQTLGPKIVGGNCVDMRGDENECRRFAVD